MGADAVIVLLKDPELDRIDELMVVSESTMMVVYSMMVVLLQPLHTETAKFPEMGELLIVLSRFVQQVLPVPDWNVAVKLPESEGKVAVRMLEVMIVWL